MLIETKCFPEKKNKKTILLKKYCSKVPKNISEHNTGQTALIEASEGTPANTKEIVGARFKRNLRITSLKHNVLFNFYLSILLRHTENLKQSMF